MSEFYLGSYKVKTGDISRPFTAMLTEIPVYHYTRRYFTTNLTHIFCNNNLITKVTGHTVCEFVWNRQNWVKLRGLLEILYKFMEKIFSYLREGKMAERKKEVVRGGLWDMCQRTNHRSEYIYQRGLTGYTKTNNKTLQILYSVETVFKMRCKNITAVFSICSASRWSTWSSGFIESRKQNRKCIFTF